MEHTGGHAPEGKRAEDTHLFTKRERIPALNGFVTAIDSRPESQTDSVPVLLAPGWSETLRTYKKGFEQLTSLGRRSIGIEHPRFGVRGIGTNGETITTEAERKAESVYSVMKAKDDVDQFDIIGHSEGAVNALIAASFAPERVRNIVLVNPAGLIGKDSFLRLVGRFGKMIGQDMGRSVRSLRDTKRRGEFLRGYATTSVETGKYLAKNPIRALAEVRYLVHNDTTELVKTLSESGINITILAAHDDPVFPEATMRQMLKEHKIAQFYTITGGHNGLNTQPQMYMTEAINALTRMKTQQELGSDRVDIFGDELIMRPKGETSTTAKS